MATEEIIEEAIRTVPLNRAWLALALGTAGGVLIGYGYAEKKLRTKYQGLAEYEITQMREHYQAKEIAREEKPKLETLVREQGYVPPPIPEKEQVAGSALTKVRDISSEAVLDDEVTPVEENVFDKHGDDEVTDEWDYEEEVRMRRPDYPYVIHVDEQGELAELDNLTWTYYEGDEVLCNASDEVVTDVERCVGLSNLDKFGHGSGDPGVVYIRNVVLGIEIEVIKSPGKYEEEVLGLQHADESIRRRKRHFDDDAG